MMGDNKLSFPKIKPFLKWAGSKFRYLEKILAVLPTGKRLIEPFTGSGAVFINSNYKQYLLAEDNADLISLFSFLQHEGENFIDYCSEFFQSSYNHPQKYYQLRMLFNQSEDLRYRAALFLFLNRHGYNGLCRYNQSGLYNVPFGSYIKPYFPYLEMQHFYKKAQQAKFIKADFRTTFKLARKGDVIYCDPPYVPLTSSSNFSSYTQKKFVLNDHMELAQLAKEYSKKAITVIISNHDTEFTRKQYKEADIIDFPVQRYISCKGNKRMAIQELVAIFKAKS